MNKPECVTCEDGFEEWRLDGELHREDGPAIEYVNGDKGWYLNGWPHREDGPAIEYADGTNEWWLDGNLVNPEAMVDLWLMRGKFCFYDKDNDCLNFG
jgi:hypothetical protein